MESKFYSRASELPWSGVQFEIIFRTAWLIKKKNISPNNSNSI